MVTELEEKTMNKALHLQRGLKPDVAHTLNLMCPGGPGTATSADFVEAHSKVIVQYMATQIVAFEEFVKQANRRLTRLEARLDGIAKPRAVDGERRES